MIFGTLSFRGCRSQPLALTYIKYKGQKSNAHCPWNMPSKKNLQDYWSFHPSEPITFGHFNVRYPVFYLMIHCVANVYALLPVSTVQCLCSGG